jgi:hypothetical protein
MIIGFSASIFIGVFRISQMPQAPAFVAGNLSDYKDGQAVGSHPLASFARRAHTGVE